MNIYGVKFSDKGKVYYFNAHDLKINNNVCNCRNRERVTIW